MCCGGGGSPEKALAAVVVAAMAVVRMEGVALLTKFRGGNLSLPSLFACLLAAEPWSIRAFHADHKGSFIINSLHYLCVHDKVSPVRVDCESPLASIYSYHCSCRSGCRLNIYQADKWPLQQGQKCQITLEQPGAVDPTRAAQYREPSPWSNQFCLCGFAPKLTCGSPASQVSSDGRMPRKLGDALASQ